MDLRINKIVKSSVVDGPGLRYVIFVQGCFWDCQGCHNPQTHNPEGGYIITTENILRDLRKQKILKGVTFSGGEPFLQAEALACLGRQIKEKFSFDIVCYTGYRWETLLKVKEAMPLLEVTDLLIDGLYHKDERDLSLLYRGSKNQRMIDVQKSLASGKLILWSE